MAWDLRLKVDGCRFYYSKPNTRTIETLLDTKQLWDGGVVVLLGDVYYTDEAMRKILSRNNDVNFYGRYGESNWRLLNRVRGTRNSELFAVTFNRRGSKAVEAALHSALKSVEGGRDRLRSARQALSFGIRNLRRICQADMDMRWKARQVIFCAAPDVWRFYAAKRGILWVAYRTLFGAPFYKNIVEKSIFINIDDITNDFDTYKEYANWMKRYKKIEGGF